MNNPIIEIKAQENLKILFIIVNIMLYLADLKLEEATQKDKKRQVFQNISTFFQP